MASHLNTATSRASTEKIIYVDQITGHWCILNISDQRKNRNPFPSSCLSPAEEESNLKVLPHGPEPCASANSATSAFAYLIKHGTFKYQCGRWDLNPHDHTTTRSLVLPVCQFQHSRSTCYNIAQFFQFCNTFFEFFLFFHLLYTISLYAILEVVLITQV